MNFGKREDEIISALADLYARHGFKRYKPVCFEEYSLYQENRNFLIGKNVITFSDLNGKLMAMRPDVTLSLVRHNDVKSGEVEKLFYNEKVYRQATGGKDYKEISQTGVEVVGRIDSAVIAELAVLIMNTLETVGGDYVLELSHMEFIEGLLEGLDADREEILACLKNKNMHDFNRLAAQKHFGKEVVDAFGVAATGVGTPKAALGLARKAAFNRRMTAAVEQLEMLCELLDGFGYGGKVSINFSATGNADYYNGVIFNGYLKGVPHCVLTGGQYDKLLSKLGKSGGAIGFALYLGEIERYLLRDDDTVDYLVIYGESTQVTALNFALGKIKDGKSVRISPCNTGNVAYRELVDFTGKEAKDD